jgi:hypothetical protein
VPVNATKAMVGGGGVDVKLHSLLTSTLGAVERSPFFPGCFTRGEADLGFSLCRSFGGNQSHSGLLPVKTNKMHNL